MAADSTDRVAHAGLDFVGQPPAVGVAQADQVGARIVHRLETGKREVAVEGDAVEEMLGVEDHLVEMLFQIRDGVVEDLQVFCLRDSQRLLDVQVPGLADHGRNRRVGLQDQL